MKKIFTLLIVFASFFTLQAQDIQIVDTASSNVVNNQTVYVTCDINVWETIQTFEIINNTTGSLDIKVQKNVISSVSGSQNTFCWSVCLLPSVTESDPLTVNAGSIQNFDGHYRPDGNTGITTVEYTFLVEGGGPQASFTIKYDGVPTGMSNDKLTTSIYPNPAKDKFLINVNEAGKEVKIYNLLGKEIKSYFQENTAETINCSKWQDGIYFVKIFDRGELKTTQKIIISD